MTRTRTEAELAALSRWAKRRRRLIGYGQWQPFTDATPVRAHVEAIRATGMSVATIVGRTGVGLGTLEHLLYGSGGWPPARQIRTEAADALLRFWPVLDDYPDGARIDATGSRRRLQALAVDGWNAEWVADRIGIASTPVYAIRSGRRTVTRARVARSIRNLGPAVSGLRPEDNGIHPAIALRTRRYAEAADWQPWIAWDDDTIDDPAAAAAQLTGTPLNRDQLADYRRSEVRHLAAFGIPAEDIAARLEVSVETVRATLRAERTAA
ncbi:hypothetical protein [Streptomyces uncialis]|uniref:hypothetical protein n=1 Tax=Streptomyces uncialis TaxID=1048205 RepID=UPI00379FB22E